MWESLPEEHDLIVLGTGMVESIIAAAAGRIGKKVLHLDSNLYYGHLWATFHLDGLEAWIRNNQNENTDMVDFEVKNKVTLEKLQNSTLYKTQLEKSSVSCASEKWFVSRVSPTDPPFEELEEHLWTEKKLRDLNRKFYLDLAPKLLFSKGEMVKLLIDSQVSRYTEFMSVNNILTYIDNRIETVPCSKSDVFSSKKISMVEKRILMKFLSYCLSCDSGDGSFEVLEGKKFTDLINEHNIPAHLAHNIVYCIALANDRVSSQDAIKRVQMFLKSLGIYGNSPFLWPMYGSSELVQAFCRLCAVFGGIYCLSRGAEAIVVDEGNNCRGIVSNEDFLSAQNVVLSATLAPAEFIREQSTRKICRCILITDGTLYRGEKDGVSLLQYTSSQEKRNPISLLELSSTLCTSPKGLYVVHLVCDCIRSPEEDFKEIIEELFCKFKDNAAKEESGNENVKGDDCNNTPRKPQILYAAYFCIDDTSSLQPSELLPGNVFLCSGPDMDVDFSKSIQQAKEIFEKMYPGEPFLEPLPAPTEPANED